VGKEKLQNIKAIVEGRKSVDIRSETKEFTKSLLQLQSAFESKLKEKMIANINPSG